MHNRRHTLTKPQKITYVEEGNLKGVNTEGTLISNLHSTIPQYPVMNPCTWTKKLRAEQPKNYNNETPDSKIIF